MKTWLQGIGIIFLLLAFPFLIAGMAQGKEGLTREKTSELETLLAGAVAEEIPDHYPFEAIKAQCVLVRSRYAAKIQKGIPKEEVFEELERHMLQNKDKDIGVCRKAGRETEGMVLQFGGHILEAPFFRCGNGTTRSGKDLFGTDEWPWLVNIASPWDLEEGRQVKVRIKKGEFVRFLKKKTQQEQLKEENITEQVKIWTHDAAGYVTEVAIGDAVCGGEQVREWLGLPSACFAMEETKEEIAFLCRGSGHGAGMSQTGAAALAKEGKNYQEILRYYFPQVTLGNMSDSMLNDQTADEMLDDSER